MQGGGAGGGARLGDVERHTVFRLSRGEGSGGGYFVTRCVLESLEGSRNDPCVCRVSVSLLGVPAEAQ